MKALSELFTWRPLVGGEAWGDGLVAMGTTPSWARGMRGAYVNILHHRLYSGCFPGDPGRDNGLVSHVEVRLPTKCLCREGRAYQPFLCGNVPDTFFYPGTAR